MRNKKVDLRCRSARRRYSNCAANELAGALAVRGENLSPVTSADWGRLWRHKNVSSGEWFRVERENICWHITKSSKRDSQNFLRDLMLYEGIFIFSKTILCRVLMGSIADYDIGLRSLVSFSKFVNKFIWKMSNKPRDLLSTYCRLKTFPCPTATAVTSHMPEPIKMSFPRKLETKNLNKRFPVSIKFVAFCTAEARHEKFFWIIYYREFTIAAIWAENAYE